MPSFKNGKYVIFDPSDVFQNLKNFEKGVFSNILSVFKRFLKLNFHAETIYVPIRLCVYF